MSETICINKKLWDQTRALLEERKIAINALEKVVTEHGKTIGEQHNELADQRRTIATLRARLQNRKGGYWSRGKQRDHWLDGWRNRYDALRTGYINLSPTCDGYSSREAKARHRQRIAAIRNFGSLPCDAPSMPGYFYDDAWHAKPADGYKGRATFDAGLNAWTWWVVGFAGYVRAESYQEARAGVMLRLLDGEVVV